MRASGLAALALAAALAAGCGGAPCRDLAAAIALIEARRGPLTPIAEPHGELVLPRHDIDRLLAESLPAIEPVEIPLPPVARMLGVPAIGLAATRVTAEPAGRGKIAAAVDLAASIGPVSLPLGAVTVEATPEVTSGGGRTRLVLRFAGDAVRSLSPSSAHRAIWARSYDALPPAIRGRLGRLEFVAAVELLARHFAGAGFGLLRRHLLSRIDEVARIEVTLPDLPISRVEIDAGRAAITARLWTDLEVAGGVEPHRGPPPTGAELRLSAETVAAIANWAIATGQAPRAHDRELRPDPGGAYTPIFGWRRGHPRPLEIHVVRFERPCGIIRVAARPAVDTGDGEIAIGVTDGVVERVEGSAAIKLGVWVSRAFRGAIEQSRSYASTTTTRIGKLTLATTARRVRLAGDIVVIELDLLARPDKTPVRLDAPGRSNGPRGTIAPWFVPSLFASPRRWDVSSRGPAARRPQPRPTPLPTAPAARPTPRLTRPTTPTRRWRSATRPAAIWWPASASTTPPPTRSATSGPPR